VLTTKPDGNVSNAELAGSLLTVVTAFVAFSRELLVFVADCDTSDDVDVAAPPASLRLAG
jgi:hypothetical protein